MLKRPVLIKTQICFIHFLCLIVYYRQLKIVSIIFLSANLQYNSNPSESSSSDQVQFGEIPLHIILDFNHQKSVRHRCLLIPCFFLSATLNDYISLILRLYGSLSFRFLFMPSVFILFSFFLFQWKAFQREKGGISSIEWASLIAFSIFPCRTSKVEIHILGQSILIFQFSVFYVFSSKKVHKTFLSDINFSHLTLTR